MERVSSLSLQKVTLELYLFFIYFMSHLLYVCKLTVQAFKVIGKRFVQRINQFIIFSWFYVFAWQNCWLLWAIVCTLALL